MPPDGIEVAVAGIGVLADGLADWAAARAILAGRCPYLPVPMVPPPPALLAGNERRRTSAVTRLALAVAGAAAASSGLPPASLRGVFACANGDGPTVGAILEALTGPGERGGLVSPTQFHNSVHNAAAGYWSIGVGSREPATCIGCHDSTAAAGLLKATAEAVAEACPVLLCAYDLPLPPPLAAARPTFGAFGAALVLVPVGDAMPGAARLFVAHAPGPPDPDRLWPRDPALAALARENPAARLLRLLEALSGDAPDQVALEFLGGRLDVFVRPS